MERGGYSSTEWRVALSPKINNGTTVCGGIMGCSLQNKSSHFWSLFRCPDYYWPEDKHNTDKKDGQPY